MERGLVITLPTHDDTIEYLSKWSSEIIDKAIEKSINVKELHNEEVTKNNFEKVIKKLDYKMIVLNGHGSKIAIGGHKEEIIIEEGINESILVNRITYARSCDSAASLGVKCMESNKEGCFIGYDAPFMFYVDENWVGSPKKDAIAELFLSSSNQVPISIIKGNNCQMAHENAKKSMLKSVRKVLRNRTPDSYRIVEALINNYLGQKIIGNPDAQLDR